MDSYNHVTVEIYRLDKSGAVIPNPLFHRSFDYLHSRCVEYPFAASQLGDVKKILDVGTVKSDSAWISWLESLPTVEVHATDHDEPFVPFKKVKFHRGDLRNLPIEGGTFDRILAVSVIEHIGLSDPQVISKDKPWIDPEGDLNAFKEMLRMVKKGSSIVMTFPFGPEDGIVLGSARNYNSKSIEKFNKLAEPVVLDYYEYQYSNYKMLFNHEKKTKAPTRVEKIKNIFKESKRKVPKALDSSLMPEFPGVVTWRRIPMEEAKATNETHIEGVLCGVWRKS